MAQRAPRAYRDGGETSSRSQRRIEEISRKRWRSFFKTFSRSHEGWLATLEVFDPACGTEVLVVNRPLVGISVDGARIVVTLDGGIEQHLTHEVDAPQSVILELEDGAETAVKIATANGQTELRFRSALPPEMVDGVAP